MNTIVIVGGGFAGLWASMAAARESLEHAGDIKIVMVSADPYLTIRPRLYEISPQKLRVPLTDTLSPIDVPLIEGSLNDIDSDKRSISYSTPDGGTDDLKYDRLVLSAGSIQAQLPISGAAQHCWNIDSWAAAVALDEHLQYILSQPDTPDNRTIVVVGGGFTGIELATEMRTRLAHHSDQATASGYRIILVERAATVGPELGDNPRPVIKQALNTENVEVLTGANISAIEDNVICFDDDSKIPTRTTIITAGMKASPLAGKLPVEVDGTGRVPVDSALRVTGLDNIFAAGDVARAYVDDDHLALMSCQHAMPMGRYAGHNAVRDLLGLPLVQYRQPDYVTCLDLGTSGAVFCRGWDRHVEVKSDEGKQIKQNINQKWIYPPRHDRAAILAAGDLNHGAQRRNNATSR